MAKIHGRLGANDLAATTNTGVYTVPSGRKATVNLTICNRNATAVTVRVAHIDGAVGAVAMRTTSSTARPCRLTELLTAPAYRCLRLIRSWSTRQLDGVSAVISGVEEDV